MQNPKIPDSTIRHLFRLCRKSRVLFIQWYIFGLLVFQAKGALDPDGYGYWWVTAYHTWQMIKDYLALMAVISFFSKYRQALFPIVIYATLRLCFQVPVIFMNVDPNTKSIVNILWLVALIATITLTIHQIKKEWKN